MGNGGLIVSETTVLQEITGGEGLPESPEAFEERKARLLHLCQAPVHTITTLYVDVVETNPEHPRFGLHTEDYLACRALEAAGSLRLFETLPNQALWRLADTED